MNYFKYIGFSFLVLFLVACGKKTETGSETAESTPAIAMSSNGIFLNTQQLAQAGIETGTFSLQPLDAFLDVNAELVLNKENTALVSAFTDGIISELRVRNNSTVAKGGIVAVLRKPELLDLQQQFLENKDRQVFLEAEYQRYKTLKENDATATKNFQKAESEWKAAQTVSKLLAAKLKQFQIDPNKLSPDNLRTELVITSPISGLVTRVDASIGQALTMGDPLCEVSNLAFLHPVLYVFEKDLSKVKPGQKVVLSFPGGREKQFAARIDYLERSVDTERKTVRVHARFDSPGVSSNSQMAKGSYFNARIDLGKEGLLSALPEEAVIQEKEGYFIFYQDKKENQGILFRKILVKRGAASNGYVAVEPQESLPANAAIVLKGAYYVSAQGAEISAEE